MYRFEYLDHTADVGLSARADTREELFEALAEGLADVICARESVAKRDAHSVLVRSDDLESLAVDFLWRVMTIIQDDAFAVAEVRVTRMSETDIEAELLGEPYDPDRHEYGSEVKAVTWHELKIAREGQTWVGRVILDL